jgi:hypothetical protein
MSFSKRLVTSSAFQETIATVGAWYLRLAWATSRHVVEPADIYDTADIPAILATWHGQHFMLPFLNRGDDRHRAKVLISRHRDGEINARAAARLGVPAIRGSGAHNGEFNRKGGAAAFTEMLSALDEGYNVAMTADVPKIARVAGMGVVKLAQHSGRPIYVVAMASSRRVELGSWDRATVNLPFSHMGLVAGGPIYVAREADSAALETARRKVESELNRVTARAYTLADRKQETKL